MADQKPSVLIVGGLGYIGRFLAKYIHENNLASDVRLVDKVLPQLAWLAPEFQEPCSNDKFVQADASKEQALSRIFDRPDGKQYDYVFNCGGETRYSQEDDVYRLRSLELSLNIGREAAKRKIKCFVELSTGMVYKPTAKPSKEDDKLKPWSKIAVFKLQAEDELSKIEGLNLMIARLPFVYGPYASQWVSTALCLARTYQSLGEDMKWLWTKDMCTNTVHVEDVTRALWAMAAWYDAGKARWDGDAKTPPTFNIVDKGATTQGTTAELISSLFGIKTGFQGAMLSNLARLNIDGVVDGVNDDVLGPWAELLEKAGITRPGPLSPFMEKELLKDTDLSLDGTRLETVVGFEYEKPKVTEDLLKDIIESYKKMNWWP